MKPPMAKKKPKPFRAVKAVKAAAREHIGAVPATRREDPRGKRQRRQQKHKPTLGRLLAEG
jgi:hypothetical protein